MAVSVHDHGRFGSALDLRNANSAAHFRAGFFRSRQQGFLHKLVREGK